MIGVLKRDAVELAKASRGDASARSVAGVVLGSDAFRVLLLQRVRETARRWRIPLVNHILRMVQTALFGIEINRDVMLGDGVWFVHSLGVIIGGDSRIGPRVRLFGNNTVGTVRDDGYPVIEEDVWIGAGARVLGPVRVGARARIGANAVVLTDVPPDHVAVGVPARILPAKDAEERPAAKNGPSAAVRA